MSSQIDQIDGTQRRNFASVHQVTTGQAAALLGVASRTVAKWIDTGKIPSWRINKDRRVLLSDLIKFADSQGIPVNIDDKVCAMKVDHGMTTMEKTVNDMKIRIDALNALVALADECLSRGTVSLGDSRTARVDADARKKFLDSLKLFKLTA
jgi:excisionase family DNA binding protein